ncbi:MAG: hypothetical protein EPN24_02210 [Candidatus Methanoperedens sp.]|nr:MAG: hypothetical protein EPN24_02210 [Candidatus Methanoperedens sp.]
MTVLKGYREFFNRGDDPALESSKEQDGMFFIFRSIEAWKEEKCKDEDIPAEELIRDEYSKNRFIAHP